MNHSFAFPLFTSCCYLSDPAQRAGGSRESLAEMPKSSAQTSGTERTAEPLPNRDPADVWAQKLRFERTL